MKCENCNNENDGKYGSGRFCSCKCARGFSTKALRAVINEKVIERCKNRDPSWYLERFKKIKFEDVFSKNSIFKSNQRIILYIKANNVKVDECEHNVWNGKKLTKHLHHKNGIKTDNRKENLELLCPNCHSQTKNFCTGSKRIRRQENAIEIQMRRYGLQ